MKRINRGDAFAGGTQQEAVTTVSIYLYIFLTTHSKKGN